MKKRLLFMSLVAAALSFAACNEDDSDYTNPETPEAPSVETVRATFPEDDGSAVVAGSPNEKAARLLAKVSVAEVTDTIGRINITEAQYAEIKAFTDELVKGCTTQKEIFMVCYNWIRDNISYDFADNDPYAVFKNRVAICQGYANLLFVMHHSQGVPGFVCNGQINQPPYGGHAWNYTCCDGSWLVSDPTNGMGGPWGYRSWNSYSYMLVSSFDILLYKEKECWFNYNEFNLNICNITSNEASFTVPFSVQGFQVTSLSPTVPISSAVKELYIGKNIISLGENYMGLMHNAPSVEYVYVDPENPTFASYLGAVYRKNGSDLQLTYIPAAMKCIELMPMETIYKNTVYDHSAVEVLVVAPGTKRIEAWGVEKCPNLKIAYVPEDVEITDNAFTDVHPDFQIIRGDYTNIPDVKED